MSPAAGSASPSDRAPVTVPAVIPFSTGFSGATGALTPAQKDKVIEWYRGEFAAANAIIDALCHHLIQISGGCDDGGAPVPEEYEAAFAAIHRRRLNWIPVLQMQKYYTIADVSLELRKAAAMRREKVTEENTAAMEERREKMVVKREKVVDEEVDVKCDGHGGGNGGCVSEGEDSPDSEITDTGSHEVAATLDPIEICDNHEDCLGRREQIKLTKGFVAKEPVKGHMVNVLKGLKMFEDIFTDSELSKLNDFVEELRAAGQNGELLGETYISFNKQMKGNKREQIQLGVPIFGQVKDEAANKEQKSEANIEDIPALLQSVIDHLVRWQILPENRKPNGCLINYFDEGEYSQPYLKPPHLDHPISTLVLSESTIAFGRTLVNDGDGNFKGQLMLSLKEGSVLVMRNNSADMARHVMCASPTKRAIITFTRVRLDTIRNHHSGPRRQAMTSWQPSNPNLTTAPNGAPIDVIPKWGVMQAPLVMLAPVRPAVMNPRSMLPQGGTGVFLPWAGGSRKPTKHLPPRAQKRRFLGLPSLETLVSDTMSHPSVEGRMM